VFSQFESDQLVFRSLTNFFSKHLGPGSYTYGVLRFCSKCVFAGKHETFMHYSLSRDQVVVIHNYKGKHYIRKGECIGFKKCGRCLESIDKNGEGFPCEWFQVR